MSKGFLLIDGSNIGHAANATRPLTVGGEPVQAVFGFVRTLRAAILAYPMLTPIVLWDGVSWRKKAFDFYKESRDAAAITKTDEKQADLRKQWKAQRPKVVKGLELLGVRQMWALNLEADDLAGMMVKRYAGTDKKMLMVSADKDWIQLIRPGVGWLDPIRAQALNHNTLPKRLGWEPEKKKIVCHTSDQDEAFEGVPGPKAWLEMKALMGDKSDEIPGVGGIGPRGALDLVRTYGTVTEFTNQVLDKTIDPAKLPAKFIDFATSEDKQILFQRNMKLMDLMHPAMPKPSNFQVNAGAFDADGFYDFCAELQFSSIINSADWTAPFQRAA